MTHLARLSQLLDDFLVSSTTYVPGQAEETSGRLTLFSQEGQFMETATQWARLNTGERAKMVLVTSLIKDKFKFDFETLGVGRLEEYYQWMVEMCRLVRVSGGLS